MVILVQILLGLDSDTFYIYHVAAVMVDNLRRLLLGINLSDKAIMDLVLCQEKVQIKCNQFSLF